MTALRPAHFPTYQSAGQWDWFVVAAIIIAGLFYLLPLREAIPLTLGATLYAMFVVDYFHRVFHLPNHWLHRYPWFQDLIVLHDAHHYGLVNFGIIFQMFGPVSRSIPAKSENLFPGFSRGSTS